MSTFGLVCITREGSNPYKHVYDSDILAKYLVRARIFIQVVKEGWFELQEIGNNYL